MRYLKPPATCWSPTTPMRLDRLKQCPCVQFAQNELPVSCMTEILTEFITYELLCTCSPKKDICSPRVKFLA